MNVLIIGGGGREHAIAWKLKQSPRVDKLYCIPGNAGIAQIAECKALSVMDFDGILAFLVEHKDIALTVVAPDNPLAAGLVDVLEKAGHRAFGPCAAAAKIEGSKSFAKELMNRYNIPTAAYDVFVDFAAAEKHIKAAKNFPLVIKADGLALGKGVIICDTEKDAIDAARMLMLKGGCGGAGKEIVIEEFLRGFEVSVLAFCDGKTIVPLVSSQDHKRAYDGDKGANTGGMGAFSPSARYTEAHATRAYDTIILPTMHALNAENRTFKGVIYFGLMIDGDKINVLEYNARFGDPETQAVLPRLKSDLLQIFEAVIDGRLDDVKIEWDIDPTLCVVAACGSYPQKSDSGREITIGDCGDAIVFHAGTALNESGKLITAGGRVLGITAKGKTMNEARQKVYGALKNIGFEGMRYRTDIGL